MHSLRLAASCPKRVALAWARPDARLLHTRRALAYPLEDGLGEFLPPDALKTVAVEYQQGLLDRLNDQVKGPCLYLVPRSSFYWWLTFSYLQIRQ
jgi:superoxide dismutase, Fe-Mn family